MMNLVHSICPESVNKFEYRIVQTRDASKWFKIINSENGPAMYSPPLNLLKTNMIVFDKFIEMVNFFYKEWSPTKLWDESEITLFIDTDEQMALTFLDIIDGYKFLACDIETEHVGWEDNKLLSIGFAVSKNEAYSIHHFTSAVLSKLQELFNRKDIKFCWHNGKFDCGRLKYFNNIDARIDEDTMLQHYVRIYEKKGTHGLKDLGALYLQAPDWDAELDRIKKEYCRKNKIKISEFKYSYIPINVLLPYMLRDCIATYRLFHVFDNLAQPSTYNIYRKLIQASNVYKRIELNGMLLDLDYIEELEFELDEAIQDDSNSLKHITDSIWDANQFVQDTGAKSIPKEFNIGSPAQLKWLLQKVTQLPINDTSADTIDSLINHASGLNEESQVLLSAIAKLRKSQKYQKTYVQGFRNNLCGDCRVRGTYNLHGTETGRLSSSDPNMQNLPRDKKIKNMIIASPGYRLVQLDYSQAELRVLAMLSEDPWLTQVYIDGKDLHDAVATDMFGPNFTKEERVMAKTINFGIAYGRGPQSIADTFNITLNEARQIIDKWYKPMPKVKEWIQNRRMMATRGDDCVTPLGRERHFVITRENLNHAQNEYINTPIQSIASDMTMFSIIDIQNYIDENQLNDKVKIIATVHDSIILEVLDDDRLVKQVSDIGQEIMRVTPKVYFPNSKVPFRADVEIGYKWGALS